MRDAKKLMMAIAFATKAHSGQTRNDGSPYILHPIRVATILSDEYNYNDVDTLCIAILHDVIEDCTKPGQEGKMYGTIKNLFGDSISGGVAVLSKNMCRKLDSGKYDIDQYYSDISTERRDIQAIKVADRIHNVSDMMNWKKDRVRKYLEETRKYVLPIAQSTDAAMYRRLYELVQTQEAMLLP